MADQGLRSTIQVADLALDEEGKVIIRDPQIARLVAAMAEKIMDLPENAVTNNCHGGNCVKGCGGVPKIEP